MANFTIQLAEYLQEHMNENQHITDLDDILAVSKECLFGGAPLQALNVLSDDYKDIFIQSFTMHFLYEEIGLETMPAWQLALASKIIDNIDFIELTFENLQNQVYSEYEVRRVESERTDKGTISTEGEAHNVSHAEGNSEDEFVGKEKQNNSRYYSAVDAQGNPTTPKIKSVHIDADGDDPIKEYSQSVRSGSVNVDNDQSGKIKDTMQDSGKAYEKITDSGSELMKERDGAGDKAYVERAPEGIRQNQQIHTGGMVHGYSDHATDSTGALSVTPQSGIDASKLMQSSVSPSGSSAGTPGSTESPLQGANTKYLTQAQHQWNNDREHSEWTKPLEAGGDVITNQESYQNFKDKQITHFNREQEREFNDREREIEQSFDDRKRESEREFTNYHQDSDTTYNNLTDKVERHYNRKTTSEQVYENNFKEHADAERSFEDRKNISSGSSDGNSDSNSTGKSTRDLIGTGNVNEKKFKFNYEIFMKSEPIMNRLWRNFDELFFLLLDTI